MLKASESYVRKLVEEEMRVDERKFDEFRTIKIEKNAVKTAEGSARVMVGNTHVLVGVKMSVGEPFPDTQNEGVLVVNAELVPVASPNFESGPPNENAIELARVVDRGIRESHCIDLESLCIQQGKEVWIVNVDIHVLDHDGNLIDASAIGAISALLTTKVPKYENGKVNVSEYERDLPVRDVPVAVTVVKIGNKLLIDPTVEEEEALDARMTLSTNEKEQICAGQKGGDGYFTTEELVKAADLSILKGKEIRNLIKG
ncbi:RNA-binding protein [Candidatus Micrarchaeota archaeon RBG_16_36_9]|nr:MAG: RNA-binding protein [Candidatus Micrarchaeota archaeon RBG_16_36_9]